MARPFVSKKRARALSLSLFFVGLALVLLTSNWWPGIMLVVGIPLALKQFLLGKMGDSLLSLAIFIGFFITAQFNISWKILLPILFITAALYILCREWLEEASPPTEIERELDLNKEIEEEDSSKKNSKNKQS